MRKFSDLSEREGGFTLIELLVVIIIIGILAAIAIPLFLDQRKLAVDASVKSDVRSTTDNIVTAQATNAGYFSAAISSGNTVAVQDNTATTPAFVAAVAGAAPTTGTANVTPQGDFSVRGSNSGGKVFVGGGAGKYFQYDAASGQFGTK